MKKEKKAFKFSAKSVPSSPGCYLFWDADSKLLYVGKAKNLKKRVSSYFQKNQKSPRIAFMVSKIAKIETRTVHSEMEALILENNLVKEFQPRFNIRLRDDKNFVYLRLTKEDFPKMEITRRLVRDGSYYIGPKTSTKEFRETVRFCQKFFRIRMTKASLDYYPHVASQKFDLSQEEYGKNVDMMKQFLNGKTREVVKTLQERMMGFSEKKNFEAAAKMRDLIVSIQASTERQRVQFQENTARDFIHFVREERTAYFVRIAFREGKLLDQNELEFYAESFAEDRELIEAFLLQFYDKVHSPPREIYVSQKLENREETEQFLSENFFEGVHISILVPQKGEKKKVLDMAEKNAKKFSERKELEKISHAENFSKALPELAEALSFKEPPSRIECFDISHFGGTSTVGSQVVFVNGEEKKSEYRRFHLKTLAPGKIDDFAAMKEVLKRRFARKDDKKFAEKMPDLIVLDGGKGQLSSVMKAVEEFQKEKGFPKKFKPKKQIIALAKREEQIFRPGVKDPIELDFESSALKLLQRIRDEAHRFAITFNRADRSKKSVTSVLDEVEGVGSATKKKLMQKFGTVSGIRKATDGELLKAVSKKQLENIRKQL